MSLERKLRCVIYTRKSSEEGLEQDFNSLHAQRESCETYVASQAGLGWKILNDRFDDGGISGATIEHPALQRLLAEIRAGRVDVVVVYKIDRLTRSLTDFARIIEVFDECLVSFVSVTQSFNTTSSMGRLTLNVLLSFAQLEREVTAERIRDKIAASKKKGMWMGGMVPLGYDNVNKKLVVHQDEAITLRKLFDLYREEKSIPAVRKRASALGLKTKHRVAARNGRASGRSDFTCGHLKTIHSNPLYIGRIRHRGQTYDGQHEPVDCGSKSGPMRCLPGQLAQASIAPIITTRTRSIASSFPSRSAAAASKGGLSLRRREERNRPVQILPSSS